MAALCFTALPNQLTAPQLGCNLNDVTLEVGRLAYGKVGALICEPGQERHDIHMWQRLAAPASNTRERNKC